MKYNWDRYYNILRWELWVHSTFWSYFYWILSMDDIEFFWFYLKRNLHYVLCWLNTGTKRDSLAAVKNKMSTNSLICVKMLRYKQRHLQNMSFSYEFVWILNFFQANTFFSFIFNNWEPKVLLLHKDLELHRIYFNSSSLIDFMICLK